jgi:hypothetical protein
MAVGDGRLLPIVRKWTQSGRWEALGESSALWEAGLQRFAQRGIGVRAIAKPDPVLHSEDPQLPRRNALTLSEQLTRNYGTTRHDPCEPAGA